MTNKKIEIKSKKTVHILLTVLCFLLSVISSGMIFTAINFHSSFATTYYLSGSGNDSFNGTIPDSAWKTIGKLNTVTLQPGDSVLFRTGDIFRGQIDLNVSGTAGQKIYFGTFGNLNHPVISGAEPISGWTKYSGNIYSADFSKPVSNFFVTGKMMTSARYPNSGFLTIDSSGVNTGLYDAALNQPDNFWRGAILKVRSASYKYEQTEIDSFTNGWLKFVPPTVNNISSGYGYYLDHTLQALDTLNEWYYDTAQKKIYFYSVTDPNTLVTEGSVYDYGINAFNNNSFVKLEGIDFEKQVKDGAKFNGTSSNILFEDCSFSNCYSRGINFNSSSADTINNCSFNSINGQGFKADELSQSVISNCVFKKIGIIPGYGLGEINEPDALLLPNAKECVISNNNIDSVGFIGIVLSGKSNLVEKNRIDHSVLILSEAGAIFLFNCDSSYSVLKDNFIFNTMGNNEATPSNKIVAHGIVLTGKSSFVTVEHNTIAHQSTNGINISSSNHDHTIIDNVIYNSGFSQIYFSEADTSNRTFNNTTKNNIFYCVNENQYSLTTESPDSTFHPGKSDSNYYCNPYSFYPLLLKKTDSILSDFPFNLDQWKLLFNDDDNSKESLVKFRRYKLMGESTTDLISNGKFTNNTDGWSSSPVNNNLLLLDNGTSLDGGCLKLEYLQGSNFPFFEFASSDINVKAGSHYLFQFSLFGNTNRNIEVFCKKNDLYSFNSLGFNKYYPISHQRSDYWDIFQATENYFPSQLGFKMFYFDSTVWIDNVSLREVTAEYIDPFKRSRLFTNYSSSPTSFSLNDSIYRDLDENIVSGSIHLQPYSSTVLVYDSLLTENVPAMNTQNEIIVFPNPASLKDKRLVIKFSKGINNSFQILMKDIYGRQVVPTKNITAGETQFNLQIPNNIASGIYIIEAVSNDKIYTSKAMLLSE